MIWQSAFPTGRRLTSLSRQEICSSGRTRTSETQRVDSLYLACKESHFEVLCSYTRVYSRIGPIPDRYHLVNLDNDALEFRALKNSSYSDGSTLPARNIWARVRLHGINYSIRAFLRLRSEYTSLGAFILVVHKHRGRTILSSQREEYLRFLKARVVRDFGKDTQLATSRKMQLERDGIMPKVVIPRLLIDIEALVEDHASNVRRTAMDLRDIPDDENSEDLINKWASISAYVIRGGL